MKEVGTFNVHCISEAISPISHMMGVSGNESVLNKESVLYNNTIIKIPVLSGNALRHKTVREPGANFLVDALGLRGELSIDQANYLYNGGSLTESSTNSNMNAIADMQMLFPFCRMLGGALRNQVVGGSLFVNRGLLVCAENKESIQKQLPVGYDMPEEAFHSAENFVSKHQYTTSDVNKTKDASTLLETQMGENDKSGLMIYAGQNVIKGALFYHSYILNNVSPLEVGALLHSLFMWQKNGGTIGGSSRIGHGKLNTEYIFEGEKDFFDQELNPERLIADYICHVDSHKEHCVDWIKTTFKEKK